MAPALFWLLFAVSPAGEIQFNPIPFTSGKACEIVLAEAAPEAAKHGFVQYCVPVVYPKLTGV